MLAPCQTPAGADQTLWLGGEYHDGSYEEFALSRRSCSSQGLHDSGATAQLKDAWLARAATGISRTVSPFTPPPAATRQASAQITNRTIVYRVVACDDVQRGRSGSRRVDQGHRAEIARELPAIAILPACNDTEASPRHGGAPH